MLINVDLFRRDMSTPLQYQLNAKYGNELKKYAVTVNIVTCLLSPTPS